jgi:hypothetical protein
MNQESRADGATDGQSPQSGALPRASRVTIRTADDLAAIPGHIGFGLQMMGVWAVGIVLSAVVAESVHPFAGLGVFGLFSALSLQFFLGGTARMFAANLQNEEVRGSRAAWAFIRSRWVGLTVGNYLALVGVLVSVAAVVWTTRSIATASPLMGSLLIVPLWVFCLFGVALFWNSQLLSAVMGVENCGAFQALLHLVNTSPLWLMETLLTVVQVTLPKILGSLLPISIALVLTFVGTAGDQTFAGGVTPESNALASLSYLVIVAMWFAYSASTMAVEFAGQYYNRSRG